MELDCLLWMLPVTLLGFFWAGCPCCGCPIYLDEQFEYEDGSDIGPNFDVVAGIWEIAVEWLRTADVNAIVVSSVEAPTPNIRVRAFQTINGLQGKSARIILNYVDEDNFYYAKFFPADACMTDEQSTGWIELYTRASGVDTILGQSFYCLGDSNTANLYACLDGTTFAAWVDDQASIEVTVTAGTSGYYGLGSGDSDGFGFVRFNFVTVTGVSGSCPVCEGDEPNSSLDPDEVDEETTGNEVYGGCEYTCIEGVAVATGGGECTGSPGGDAVATGTCPDPPAGICDDEEMDEEVFYLACDEGPPPSGTACAHLSDPTPTAISISVAGVVSGIDCDCGALANGDFELTQTAACTYEWQGDICNDTASIVVIYGASTVSAAINTPMDTGSGTASVSAPYALDGHVISLANVGVTDCDFSGATVTINSAAGGGGGPPAGGGCRAWACSWLSNGAGWARIDNSTFVCPSAACRCMSPPGTGTFGQLKFTQCTPIG